MSLSLMSRGDHSVLSPVFVNEAERRHRCLMGLLVLKAFYRPGRSRQGRTKDVFNKTVTFCRQTARASSENAGGEADLGGKARDGDGWSSREVGGERDRVTAGGDSRGRGAGRGSAHGMDASSAANARISPRSFIPLPLFYFISLGHGARILPLPTRRGRGYSQHCFSPALPRGAPAQPRGPAADMAPRRRSAPRPCRMQIACK